MKTDKNEVKAWERKKKEQRVATINTVFVYSMFSVSSFNSQLASVGIVLSKIDKSEQHCQRGETF